MLICLEMAIFSAFHLYSYSWRPYRVDGSTDLTYRGGLLGVKAIFEAANVWDILQELARAWKWVLMGGKGQGQDQREMMDK